MSFPERCYTHAKKEWNGWKMSCPWCKITELNAQLESARVEIRRLAVIEKVYKDANTYVEQMNKDLAEGKY